MNGRNHTNKAETDRLSHSNRIERMDRRKFGVLIIAHGSRSTEWVQLVENAICDTLLARELPVELSFLEIVEGRLIHHGIERLVSQGVTDIVAVPLFVSSGSTHLTEISSMLGVIPEVQGYRHAARLELAARVHLTPPMDDAEEIVEIVLERARELSTAPGDESLLLIGHGSDEPGHLERWRSGLARLARMVQQHSRYRAVHGALLLPDETGSQIAACRELVPDGRIVAVPLFLSEGYFTEKVIPARLAGKNVLYNGRALLPHRLVAQWVERQVTETLGRL